LTKGKRLAAVEEVSSRSSARRLERRHPCMATERGSGNSRRQGEALG
jgi:hypothetical protein